MVFRNYILCYNDTKTSFSKKGETKMGKFFNGFSLGFTLGFFGLCALLAYDKDTVLIANGKIIPHGRKIPKIKEDDVDVVIKGFAGD